MIPQVASNMMGTMNRPIYPQLGKSSQYQSPDGLSLKVLDNFSVFGDHNMFNINVGIKIYAANRANRKGRPVIRFKEVRCAFASICVNKPGLVWSSV